MLKLSLSCVFGFRLAQGPLVNLPNTDKQFLFPIGSPNCTLSTFQASNKSFLIENVTSNLHLTVKKEIVTS